MADTPEQSPLFKPIVDCLTTRAIMDREQGRSFPLTLSEAHYAARVLLLGPLADALDTRHLVRIGDDDWTIQHPLIERLTGTLFECQAGLVLDDFDEPDRGVYVLNDDGTIGDPVEQ